MESRRRGLRISDLLGCRIVTAEGKVIGHVADVQLTPGPEFRVTALLFGRRSWLYRLHVLNPLAERASAPAELDRVAWEAVAHIKHGTIKLKEGYQPEKQVVQ